MSKLRLNTELRNKLFNKIKDVFENENTQEKEAYLQARENVDVEYTKAFELATDIVERSYPPEDVKVLRHFKSKYGSPCDVVAKDKCFYFAHTENVDEDNKETETKSHLILVCLVILQVVNTQVMRDNNLLMPIIEMS